MRQRFIVVVHLLAVAEDRVLLVRRAGTGRADGLWAPPGGHLDAGEFPLAAAVRECAEETGLALDAARVSHCATLAWDDGGAAGLNLLFGIDLEDCAAVEPDPRSASEAAWHPIGSPPADAVPWLGTALERRAAIAALGLPDAPWYGELPDR